MFLNKQYKEINNLINNNKLLMKSFQKIEILKRDTIKLESILEYKILIELTSIKIAQFNNIEISYEELMNIQYIFKKELRKSQFLDFQYLIFLNNEDLELGLLSFYEDIKKVAYINFENDIITKFEKNQFRKIEIVFYPNEILAGISHQSGKYSYIIPKELLTNKF